MAKSFLRRHCGLLLAGTFLVFTPIASSRADDGPRIASAEARELWIKGSDQILAGDFKTGIKTIQQVDKAEPGNKGVRSALSWMKELDELEQSRDSFRQAMYDFYVAKPGSRQGSARRQVCQAGRHQDRKEP
ncbi:MAG: hypothetical protein IPK83_14920 [Planctomycetes bacterium]|nr:hypothetical protein [Planctomycetota bacterium]